MLLTPGYWPATYFPSSYWQTGPEYWPIYGVISVFRRGISGFGFSMRDGWR